MKIVGLFCHGPESCRLVFRAKDRESKFEANFQLGLLTSMYTSSGYATPASMLSAISAIIVISKTGVQNLMQRHGKKLSETSVLGKICVAASALPVFLLVNAFKIGFRSYIRTWNAMISLVAGTSLIVLANLALIILKMQNQFQEMTFTSLNQSVMSDSLGMHLWPKSRDGKRIGLAMTVLTFVFIGGPGIFLIASPEPRTRSWMAEANNTEPNKLYLDSRSWMQSINQTTDKLQDWTYGTGERLKIASISTLALGSVALVMLISLIMHEDDWVANIVAKFPKKENEAVDKDKKRDKGKQRG